MRTPISRSKSLAIRTPAREAGFTLLELLAVMVVLALAAAAFSLAIGRNFGTAQFRSVLLESMALARQTRTAAIGTASDQILMIDLDNRRLWRSGGGQTVEIPREVTLAVTVADSERYPDGTVGIRFLPSGGASGGTLDFSWRNDRYEMRVNWLTGSVTLTRG